jgi:hypothetical protein
MESPVDKAARFAWPAAGCHPARPVGSAGRLRHGPGWGRSGRVLPSGSQPVDDAARSPATEEPSAPTMGAGGAMALAISGRPWNRRQANPLTRARSGTGVGHHRDPRSGRPRGDAVRRTDWAERSRDARGRDRTEKTRNLRRPGPGLGLTRTESGLTRTGCDPPGGSVAHEARTGRRGEGLAASPFAARPRSQLRPRSPLPEAQGIFAR